jgi:hypothetical protein
MQYMHVRTSSRKDVATIKHEFEISDSGIKVLAHRVTNDQLALVVVIAPDQL